MTLPPQPGEMIVHKNSEQQFEVIYYDPASNSVCCRASEITSITFPMHECDVLTRISDAMVAQKIKEYVKQYPIMAKIYNGKY